MKKFIKRFFLVIGILLLLVVLFFAGYSLKANSMMKSMTPSETGEITEGIYAIRDSYTTMFLIRDGDSFIAIDCGNKPEAISEGLSTLGIDPLRVSTVFLTHTDGDHTGALQLFSDATIYLSTQEEKLLTGEASRFLFFGNSISRNDYILVNDREELTIGNRIIKGILTPGHTAGSMCYLIDGQYLFTGDALCLRDGKIEPFIRLINVDADMATESISLVTDLPGIRYIFTSHYGYTDDYENAVKDWGKRGE